MRWLAGHAWSCPACLILDDSDATDTQRASADSGFHRASSDLSQIECRKLFSAHICGGIYLFAHDGSSRPGKVRACAAAEKGAEGA